MKKKKNKKQSVKNVFQDIFNKIISMNSQKSDKKF